MIAGPPTREGLKGTVSRQGIYEDAVHVADEAEVAARGALGALDEAEPHGPAEDLRSTVEPLGADRRGPHCKRCRAARRAQRYDHDAPTPVVGASAEGVRVRVLLCAHVRVCVRGRAAVTAKGGAGGAVPCTTLAAG